MRQQCRATARDDLRLACGSDGPCANRRPLPACEGAHQRSGAATCAASARLVFTSGATCPRQPDQTPHAAIERGNHVLALAKTRRNSGVGPTQRHGSKAVAGAWRLAGQDVCIERVRCWICRRYRRHLLDGDWLAVFERCRKRPLAARIPRAQWSALYRKQNRSFLSDPKLQLIFTIDAKIGIGDLPIGAPAGLPGRRYNRSFWPPPKR